ncbi:MAG: hypothetical protein R3181_15235, partial [Rubricoccaceae bacterium]|nr:hypothetical protein [Rubricoccaceae bacterium]
DLGVRTGLAFYGRDGRLQAYRSQNFGTRGRLRRGASALLSGAAGLERLVLEGGGDLAEVWTKEGVRRGLDVRVVDADTWRRALLLPRQQRNGAQAKGAADGLARAVIAWSGAPAPKGALRHDAAEAIGAGLWGVVEAGWLPALPPPLRR